MINAFKSYEPDIYTFSYRFPTLHITMKKKKKKKLKKQARDVIALLAFAMQATRFGIELWDKFNSKSAPNAAKETPDK